MAERPAGAPRPAWEEDDEYAEPGHRLTAADRALILAGRGPAARTGALAGILLGFGPWAAIVGSRALLGGGWSFAHWTVNLTAYAVLSAGLGAPMGLLRRWSCLGHRFGTIPVVNWRAGWHTWLGLVAVDALVIVIVAEDGLGELLLIVVFGLLWLGVLYDRVWTAIQDALMRREGGARASRG